jgi:Outer membrane protein beta-barrel domain
MDKYLHSDIGEQFNEVINSLSQTPREFIWDNIDKTLDKNDAENYKEKVRRLKKRNLLLLLLLICISTFSLIYFNATKNNNKTASVEKNKETNNNNIATLQKENNVITTNTFNKESIDIDNKNKVESKKDIVTMQSSQNKSLVNLAITNNQQIHKAIITNGEIVNDDTENLIPNKKIIKTRKSKIKTTDLLTSEDELVKEINATTNDDKKNAITNPLPESNTDQNIVKKILPSVDLSNKKVIAIVAKKENKKKPTKFSKFTLTAFVAPDFTNYRLENDELTIYDNKNKIANREQSDVSPTVGVLIGYDLNKKITFQSGLTYSSSNISIDPSKIYAEKDVTGNVKYRYNTSFGYGYLLPSFNSTPAIGDSLFANGANHTLNYLSIPIAVKYNIGHKKITFHPSIGVTLNFLTKATLTTDVENSFNRETEYISKLESIKKFSTSLLLTSEIRYPLSKQWSVTAIPYFKYSLGAVNKGNVVKTYPYTFGLGFGVVYKF